MLAEIFLLSNPLAVLYQAICRSYRGRSPNSQMEAQERFLTPIRWISAADHERTPNPEQTASPKQTVGQRAARASFARKVILASVLVIAVPPFISVNALAQHRETVDASTYPWSSIGKLGAKVDRLGSCTGVVVGSNHFLTAAHCLYNKAAGRFVSAESVHLLLGYTKGEYRVRRLASRYLIPPTFEPALEPAPAKIATLRDDWAILYVNEPFPSEVRPLPLASETPPPGRAVKTGGYAAERAYMMAGDQHCRVKTISPDRKLIAHDCVVHHGDSGSPLLDADGDDEGLILGLNVTAYSKLVELQDQSRQGGLTVSTVSIIEFLSLRAKSAEK
jgi:protease YdgD